MDPTAALCGWLAIGNSDRLALCVIGWSLVPMPEPRTDLLFATGPLGLVPRLAKRNGP